jgi:nucleoid DNA-binding protein
VDCGGQENGLGQFKQAGKEDRTGANRKTEEQIEDPPSSKRYGEAGENEGDCG